MIIDAHAHISTTDYGCVEIYLAQLQDSGVDQGLVVPGGMMDVRKMTDYVIGRAKPENLEPNNPYVQECCSRYAEKIHGFICLNPHDATAPEQLERAFNEGFCGLKLSPMSHEFSFAAKVVAELAAVCGEAGFPLYTHVVFSPGASTARLVALARQFPKTNFILGHMGFGPADQDALAAAATLDNFFLETSTGNFLHIGEVVRKAGASKLIFGSEFPLSHPGVELQKILWLKLRDSDRDRILGENIVELLRLTGGGERDELSEQDLIIT
ncbi:MAG TPA: amidohydrolase family protein [Bacillota bacterium]|nr:amidohydrolase family protein [Bacillota bacterium]